MLRHSLLIVDWLLEWKSNPHDETKRSLNSTTTCFIIIYRIINTIHTYIHIKQVVYCDVAARVVHYGDYGDARRRRCMAAAEIMSTSRPTRANYNYREWTFFVPAMINASRECRGVSICEITGSSALANVSSQGRACNCYACRLHPAILHFIILNYITNQYRS